jgi:hypothetical protein
MSKWLDNIKIGFREALSGVYLTGLRIGNSVSFVKCDKPFGSLAS